MKSYLKGKKTYVTAVLAMISAAGSYLLDEIPLQDMIEACFAALTAMTIRAAIGRTDAAAADKDPMGGVQDER
ncbi:hypothetical protein [Sneathiella sp.]|uniref:hypothetical protein n=1 Tax=Sneathiella sp. TaxID=1964365 RepID=UPI002FE34A43